MPTVVTHAVVPLALGLGLGPRLVPGRLLAAGAIAGVLPDVDAVGFHLGVAYASALGHRGATHSLLFALAVALLGAALARPLRARPLPALLFLLAAAASHPLLDACTTGGLGVALLWPLDGTRWFAPWRVVAVSPMGLRQLLGPRGAVVLLSELRWIWSPAAAAAGLVALARRAGRRSGVADRARPGRMAGLDPTREPTWTSSSSAATASSVVSSRRASSPGATG